MDVWSQNAHKSSIIFNVTLCGVGQECNAYRYIFSNTVEAGAEERTLHTHTGGGKDQVKVAEWRSGGTLPPSGGPATEHAGLFCFALLLWFLFFVFC